MQWDSPAAHQLKVWGPALPPRAWAEPKFSGHPDKDKSHTHVSLNPTPLLKARTPPSVFKIC